VKVIERTVNVLVECTLISVSLYCFISSMSDRLAY